MQKLVSDSIQSYHSGQADCSRQFLDNLIVQDSLEGMDHAATNGVQLVVNVEKYMQVISKFWADSVDMENSPIGSKSKGTDDDDFTMVLRKSHKKNLKKNKKKNSKVELRNT